MADTRTELVKALMELGGRYPDWRFGQLVCNAASFAENQNDEPSHVWDVSDEEMLRAVLQHLSRTPAPSAKAG